MKEPFGLSIDPSSAWADTFRSSVITHNRAFYVLHSFFVLTAPSGRGRKRLGNIAAVHFVGHPGPGVHVLLGEDGDANDTDIAGIAVAHSKELVTHSKDSRRYVYMPAVPEKRAKTTALRQLLATFFEGSPEKLVASLLDPKDQKLSKDEIVRIRKLIDSSGGK
jgi:hypothetical protein